MKKVYIFLSILFLQFQTTHAQDYSTTALKFFRQFKTSKSVNEYAIKNLPT